MADGRLEIRAVSWEEHIYPVKSQITGPIKMESIIEAANVYLGD